MASSREDRMASRLRGAGRHQVEDISFNFVLPEPEPSIIAPSPPAPAPKASNSAAPPPPQPTPPPAPAPRSANPNTSAKRRRIASAERSPEHAPARTPVAPLALPPPTVTRSGRRISGGHSPEDAASRASARTARSQPAIDALRRGAVQRTPGGEADEDEIGSLPRPTPTSVRRSAVAARVDIVEESPVDAPGSGQRRRVVRVSDVATSSGAMLQRVMQQQSLKKRKSPPEVREEDEEDELTGEVDVELGEGSPRGGSSPLVRKLARNAEKKSAEQKRRKSARESLQTTAEEEDELTAEVDVSGLRAAVASTPVSRNTTRNAESTAKQSVKKFPPTGRTARRSGGAAAFGLEEVDELSPAPASSAVAVDKRVVRLSGASVADEVDELSPAPATTSRRNGKLARAAANDADELSPAPARSARRSAKPSTVSEAGGVDQPSPAPIRTAKRISRPSPLSAAPDEVDEISPAPTRSTRRSAKTLPGTEDDELDEPSLVPVRSARRSVRVSDVSTALDEVDELSPAAARKGGRSAKLFAETEEDELNEPSLAPAKTVRRKLRVSTGSGGPFEVDELSPEKTREVMGPPPPKRKPQKETVGPKAQQKESAKTRQAAKKPEEPQAASTPKPRRARPKPKATEAEPPEEPEEAEEPEQAEEISATEAAQRLGRKRPRRSLAAPSSPEEPEQEEEEDDEEEMPATKRRRRKPPPSPAAQQPPKTRKEKNRTSVTAAAPKKPPAKRKTKPSSSTADQDELDTSQGQPKPGTFPITVQRFTRLPATSTSDPDPLSLPASHIPFASRAGVNAIDVLAQMCDEMVASFLANLSEQGRAAADAAARREVKTMMRALEMFREELKTRLLEHTIALDTLCALRKRVRQAQREKIALREEIMRVRREREGVEVRKDAVRVRHEGERKEAMEHISLSTTMHNVDLAVGKGLAGAEPLSAKEQSEAELANLEFVLAKVGEQASSKSDGGGSLRQIREFNAFLERAAAALEGR